MTIKHKTIKYNKLFVSGKGLCKCGKKQYVVGKGLMDIPIALFKSILPNIVNFAKNKDLSKNIGKFAFNTVKDSVSIGNSVKEI